VSKHKAQRDDFGVSTEEDLGTKYTETKVWTVLNPDILKCQRLIDVCMAKIALTEGLGNSSVESQKALLTVMVGKWSAGMLEFFCMTSPCLFFL